MRSRKVVINAIFVLLAIAVPAIASGQGFKIVIHENNTAETISKKELADIFLRKTGTWSTGQPVLPVDQAATSATRNGFSRVILGRDANTIKSYWQRQIFSGRGVPPPELDSDEKVLAYIGQNPGSVGYVSSDAEIGPGVKVLEIGKK